MLFLVHEILQRPVVHTFVTDVCALLMNYRPSEITQQLIKTDAFILIAKKTKYYYFIMNCDGDE